MSRISLSTPSEVAKKRPAASATGRNLAYGALLGASLFAAAQLANLAYYQLLHRIPALAEALCSPLLGLGLGLWFALRFRRSPWFAWLGITLALGLALANVLLVVTTVESGLQPRWDDLSLDMVQLLLPAAGPYLARHGGTATIILLATVGVAVLLRRGVLPRLLSEPHASRRQLRLALACTLLGGAMLGKTIARPVFDTRALGPTVTLAVRAAGLLPPSAGPLLINPAGAPPWQAPRATGLLPQYRELPQRGRGMNVLVVVGESLTAMEMGPYGGPVPMPNLQRLLEQGLLVERAYTHHNFSSQAMAAIALGTEPVPYLLGHGRYNHHEGPSLGRKFSANGYRTFVLWGGNPDAVGSRQIARGADHWDELLFLPEIDPAFRQGDDRQLLEAFARQLDAAPGQPFLGMLWTFETHAPYGLWLHRGEPEPVDAPRTDPERYRQSVAELDRHLGRLESELRRRNLWDNTLVVLTGDHGEGLGVRSRYNKGHGMVFYEPNVRVPLILANPVLFPQPLRDSRIVQLKDLPATLAQLVLGEGPEFNDGISLLEARDREQRAAMVNATGFAWVRGRYKLQQHPLLDGSRELFDLQADPAERHNLYEERPQLVTELEDEMRSWYRQWLQRWRP